MKNQKKIFVPFIFILASLLALAIVGAAQAEISTSKNFRGKQPINRTKILLTAEQIVVAEGGTGTNGYGSITLYGFPEGLIAIHGGVADITATFASGVANGSGIDLAIGTVANTDGDVTDSNEGTIVSPISVDPFTNTTSAVSGTLSASSLVDGTTSAKSAILNFTVDDGDISASATGTVSGVVWILWSEVGDN